jgi:hypothetical protein
VTIVHFGGKYQTGVKQQTFSANPELNIYPNPCSNEATVEFDLGSDELVTLSVYDILSRKIFTQSEKSDRSDVKNHVRIDTHSLSPGYYRIVVETRTQIQSGALVIVR